VHPRVVEAFEDAADVGVALYIAAVRGELDLAAGFEKLLDFSILLSRVSSMLITIDWMINPRTVPTRECAFQAHSWVEIGAALRLISRWTRPTIDAQSRPA
jgi:hypothetical protein